MKTAIVALVLLTGCGSARILPPTAADATREENASLRATISQLETRVAELEAQLAVTELGLAKPETLSHIPFATRLEIDRLTGSNDTDNDGRVDEIVVYVRPLDGLGRFTQIVGELGATAMSVEGGQEPKVLGSVQLSAADVRDAYRSSLMGTHYVVRIPVAALDHIGDCIVRVDFRDGLRQQTIGGDRRVAIRRDE